MNDPLDVPRISDGAGLLDEIPLPFVVPVGTTEITLAEVLALGPGSTLELDAGVDAPVDLVVNGIPVATGRLVLAEGNFAVRIESVHDGIGQAVLGGAGSMSRSAETPAPAAAPAGGDPELVTIPTEPAPAGVATDNEAAAAPADAGAEGDPS